MRRERWEEEERESTLSREPRREQRHKHAERGVDTCCPAGRDKALAAEGLRALGLLSASIVCTLGVDASFERSRPLRSRPGVLLAQCRLPRPVWVRPHEPGPHIRTRIWRLGYGDSDTKTRTRRLGYGVFVSLISTPYRSQAGVTTTWMLSVPQGCRTRRRHPAAFAAARASTPQPPGMPLGDPARQAGSSSARSPSARSCLLLHEASACRLLLSARALVSRSDVIEREVVRPRE